MSASAVKHHAFRPTAIEEMSAVQDTPAPPAWPSFNGTSQFVGTSPSGRVTVFVDPGLGLQGQQNAQDLVNDADRIVTANDALFASAGGPVSVIVFALGGVTNGRGGADHLGCDYSTGAAIEICASFGSPMRVSGLFEAELSECSMGGNLCGVSTGEALSRWCAAVISNNALTDFASAPTWAGDGMPNYVNTTDPTDRNAKSVGCGMAFISWLMNKGYGLGRVAQAMVSLGDSGTLAQLYANLTGDAASNAWSSFQAAIESLPGGVTNDDPFGALQQGQSADRTLPAVELGTKVVAAILAGIAADKEHGHIVAGLQAILNGGAAVDKARATGTTCYSRSRRLLPPD